MFGTNASLFEDDKFIPNPRLEVNGNCFLLGQKPRI